MGKVDKLLDIFIAETIISTLMTKFVLITAKHSPEELKQMVMRQSETYILLLDELYKSFSWFEIDSPTEFEMYAILDQRILEKLAKVYSYFELNWTFKDLTKQVLRYDREKLPDSVPQEVKTLMFNFITENTTLDTILEKINELGSDKLNTFEKQMLKEASES